MLIHDLRTDLPVLLLYDLDPAWQEQVAQERRAVVRRLASSLAEVGHPVIEVCIQSPDLEMALAGFPPDDYLVFNWCEELPGIPHSNYRVAQALERLGFAFTGSNSAVLALSQDKRRVKRLLSARHIPTPEWQVAADAHPTGWGCFPAIVKPAFEHCSLGITTEAVVESPAELARRVKYVLETFKQPALIEEFIDGRELHLTVLGNGELRMLPPAEMDFSAFEKVKDRLCTFESKFDPQSVHYRQIGLRLPAPLTARELRQLNQVARSAYDAMNCRDYARLDLRLRDGIFYVLDVNPDADLCPDASLVMSAEWIGLSYGALGSLLVNLAAQRHPRFRR